MASGSSAGGVGAKFGFFTRHGIGRLGGPTGRPLSIGWCTGVTSQAPVIPVYEDGGTRLFKVLFHLVPHRGLKSTSPVSEYGARAVPPKRGGYSGTTHSTRSQEATANPALPPAFVPDSTTRSCSSLSATVRCVETPCGIPFATVAQWRRATARSRDVQDGVGADDIDDDRFKGVRLIHVFYSSVEL